MTTIVLSIAVGHIVQRRRYTARRTLTDGEAALLNRIVCDAVGAGADIDAAVLKYLRGL